MATKITGLSQMNVLALSEVFRKRVESGEITLGKTFAMFDMSASEAEGMVTAAILHLPGRRHPKASLWAVQRRLHALTGEPVDEQLADDLEAADGVITGMLHNDEPLEQEVVYDKDNIDKAALFLTELNYPNMFELRGTSVRGKLESYCKVCGEIVPRNQQERHHGAHKRDRATYATEQIRARKESSDMAKAKKITPKDQGVPAVYLNEDGSKFRPGADASLKRDLIAAIDSLENPNGLHTFEEGEAAKILAARDWNDWLIKSRKGREAKAAREAAAVQKKAEREKANAAAKKAKATKAAKADAPADTTEVKSDPKPTRKARGARTRKVGS